MSTDAWGIDDQFEDSCGVVRRCSPATRAAILKAMGAEDDQQPPDARVEVLRPGKTSRLRGPGQLRLEDGTELSVKDQFPPDLPHGYHNFFPAQGVDSTRLIVSPGCCWLPTDWRAWGWAVQLYATRSAQSWGIGDLADLRSLAQWSKQQGAGTLLTNPLHAVAPVLPQESSPYFPSSRRFRNPLYLHIEDVPGYSDSDARLSALAQQASALNAQRLIRRDEVFRFKSAALETLWESFSGDPAFDRYCNEQGESLIQFATYCALAETFGKNWRQWDNIYHQPDGRGIRQFAEQHQNRIHYHQWLQWLLDEQLSRAAAVLPSVQDLPIGADPDGADAWAWQDCLAEGVRIGAPPDIFNTQGQDWGLPPFVPHKLRAANYEPFVEIIRATLRHAGGLRIDHVLGLFRAYWIPAGVKAGDGAYVRYPVDDLLSIVALESQRAAAFVVGEDLGTVEPGVREKLAQYNILSYRLLWFERDPPEEYPRRALAAVTTHDLPTVAGLWSGADLRVQRELDLHPNEEGMQELRDHLQSVADLDEGDSNETAVEHAYRALSRAPAIVLTATLEDALAIEERPNIPSTTYQWPNWSLGLPSLLESLEEAPLAMAIASALSRGIAQTAQRLASVKTQTSNHDAQQP